MIEKIRKSTKARLCVPLIGGLLIAGCDASQPPRRQCVGSTHIITGESNDFIVPTRKDHRSVNYLLIIDSADHAEIFQTRDPDPGNALIHQTGFATLSPGDHEPVTFQEQDGASATFQASAPQNPNSSKFIIQSTICYMTN